MRRKELDKILTEMLDASTITDGKVLIDSRKDVSDLNFTVNRPMQVEHAGQLTPAVCNPPVESLSPFQTETIALNLVGVAPRLLEDLIESGSCDCSYSVDGVANFRVNVFSQRGSYSVVLRKLNTQIPTLEELKMPPIFKDISREKTGLVLVTGATGSGKSTTLAGLLNEINENEAVHVITLEDPVEFIHPHKRATFNQRQMGSDFRDFATGLRAALRQAPKVILVGEMRDRETVEIGLAAAETGHLVMSTLHTIDAGQSVNRILGMFETEEQEQIRKRLADTLRWVVCQRLVPKNGGGRHALIEIMGSNLRVKESITQGESDGRTFYEIIESSLTFGWRTFDQACLEAYDHGVITEEVALAYCSKKGIVTRGIDRIKKTRGENTTSISDLRMRPEAAKAAKPPALPEGGAPGLKLKLHHDYGI